MLRCERAQATTNSVWNCPSLSASLLKTRLLLVLEQSNSNHVSGEVQEADMNGIIYLIGLIVVLLAVLSFFGLH
jgi:hypothetical protein